MRRRTIRQLISRSKSRAAYQQASVHNLKDLIREFSRITDLIQKPADLTRVASEFIQDEAAQGIVYTEPMVGPRLYARRFGYSSDRVMRLLLDAMQDAAAKAGIEVGVMIGKPERSSESGKHRPRR